MLKTNKMTLEKIVNEFVKYNQISGLAKNLGERGQDPTVRAQIYKDLGKYIKAVEPNSGQATDVMIEDIIMHGKDNFAGQLIGDHRKMAQDGLVAAVNEGYRELVNAIAPEILSQVAMGLDKDIGKYKQLEQEVHNGEIDNARNAYTQHYIDLECPTIANYIARSDPEQYKVFAKMFFQNAVNKLSKKLGDKVEEDTPKGKKITYVPNTEKIRNYVLEKVEGTEEKKRTEIYLQLASAYVQQLQER